MLNILTSDFEKTCSEVGRSRLPLAFYSGYYRHPQGTFPCFLAQRSVIDWYYEPLHIDTHFKMFSQDARVHRHQFQIHI
ncbi:hypothetical protein HYPSUDRAFT_42151 [Hypholoma sublateritium FD-334 SS-4]|uniref:Uncharacterized protein n=1 Tax=Hypholoma sublateritium (strain FD-334 SS-4) TaxID=945553 RepID=A0A0D2PN49_HYPSF|nr:hypothetical protein HYPSUDRAFT_42151 [Hypholoma sublateritium FD-334 SS-4]